jgi:TM2 domain-containing membrane protein YozV
MNMFKRVLFKGAVIIFMTAPFLFPVSAASQELILKENKNPLNFNNSMPYNNVLAVMDSLNSDSVFTVEKKKVTEKKFRMKKSPTVAVLLSAALPGAGQFYNESYWKIPIVGGLVGYFGYEYFRNNNLYKDYRNQYSASQTELNPSGDQNLKTLREFYRDQRDDFVWYFLIVYVINMVDAYVDAHMFDFDVKEDKLMNLNTGGRHYRLKMNLRF